MALLRQVWQDVQRGENIDLYATLLLASVVTILGLLGVASQALVTSLILATLALVIFTMLGNRHRLQTILERVNLTPERDILREFPAEIASDLNNAREAWMTGIHLSALIRKDYAVLKAKLNKGDRLHVLLVDPSGAACNMSAMRSAGQVDAMHERVRIQSSLNSLCELQKEGPGKLEIRVLDYLPEYEALLLDPDTRNGVCYLTRYSFKTQGRKPKFIYRRSEGDWFMLIRSEISELWSAATPWSCSERESGE